MQKRIHRGLIFGALVVRGGAEWFASLFKGWVSAAITILGLCGVAVVLVRLDPLWIVLLVSVVVGAALVKGAFRAWDGEELRATRAESALGALAEQLEEAQARPTTTGPVFHNVTAIGAGRDNFHFTGPPELDVAAAAAPTAGKVVVYIADLARGSGVIRGRTFANYEVRGPALVHFRRCGFMCLRVGMAGGSIESLLWEAPPGAAKVGAILVEDCVFEHCVFADIGLAGTAVHLAEFRQNIQLP